MASLYDDDYDAFYSLFPPATFNQPVFDATYHAPMDTILQRGVSPDQLADLNAPITASCATCSFEVCLCALSRELDTYEKGSVPEQLELSRTGEHEKAFATEGIKTSKSSRKHDTGKPKRPKTRATKIKGKRAWISDVARSILEGHFLKNPYLNKDAIVSLQGETELPERTIRNWFSNTRSRKLEVESKSNSGELSPSRLSSTSLKAHDRLSAAGSQVSLEKWLAEPEDPTILPSGPLFLEVSTGAEDLPLPHRSTSMPPESYKSQPGSMHGSRAGSVRSKGSSTSRGSQSSLRSVDLRGSRRGRRQWKEQTRMGKNSNGAFYCTWPTCQSSFSTRFQWIRHEEAVHYCPYRWICCYDNGDDENVSECFVCRAENVTLRHITKTHFQSCKDVEEPQRVFWRSDQLTQHVKGAHGHECLPSNIEKAWRSRNPAFDESHMRCGFCEEQFDTWEARRDHVLKHIKQGATKDSWRPERHPVPGLDVSPSSSLADSLSFGEGRYSCPPGDPGLQDHDLRFDAFRGVFLIDGSGVPWI